MRVQRYDIFLEIQNSTGYISRTFNSINAFGAAEGTAVEPPGPTAKEADSTAAGRWGTGGRWCCPGLIIFHFQHKDTKK